MLKVFRRRNVPTSGTNGDLLAYFFDSVLIFTSLAYLGFELRLGPAKALKRVAAGEVWKTIGQCQSARAIQEFECVRAGIRIDEEDQVSDYSLVEAFVRESFLTYENKLRSHGLYYPPPNIPKRERMHQSLIRMVIGMATSSIKHYWLVTQNGYIAQADREVREDDLLCLISGCQTLCILRLVDGETFKLVSMIASTDCQESDFLQWVKEAEERKFLLR